MNLALHNNLFSNILDDFERDLVGLNRSKDPVKFDLIENKENYNIRAVVPGFTQDDIDISINNRRLTVSGKKDDQSQEVNLFYSSQTSFKKIYLLPDDAIPDNINAEMHNGILVVNIPRWGSENVENERKIPVGKPPPLKE